MLREHALNQSLVLFGEDLDIDAYLNFGIPHKTTSKKLITSPEQAEEVNRVSGITTTRNGIEVLDVDAIMKASSQKETNGSRKS